ncbi:MAG: GNAT family N-acetyltransferase [Candidatus Helarchaeota archaeon]
MKYEIVEGRIGKDDKEIINFWKKNFPEWPIEKYNLFYKSNINNPVNFWIVKEGERKNVVGMTSIFPRKFWHQNEVILAGITGDFAVDKNYRFLGPALQLQRRVVESCDTNIYKFLYGYPNNKSEPVQRRVGFKVIGHSVRLVKVLRYENYLKRIIKLTFLNKIIAFFVDFFMKIIDNLHSFRKLNNYSYQVVRNFNKEFDVLWEKSKNEFVLIGERNSWFLNWRVKSCSYKNYQSFVLKNKKYNEMVGYIIFYINGKGINVFDCLAINNKTLKILFLSFSHYARKNGYHSISIIYFGREEYIKILKSLNFYKRKDTRNIVVYAQPENKYYAEVMNKENWYFFEIDVD